MAVALSSTTYQPNLLYGEAAMAEAKAHAAGEALEQVALANIVSTGLVSLLIDEHFNGAIAHAVFYGMTRLPKVEKRVLHGDCVGYGNRSIIPRYRKRVCSNPSVNRYCGL